MGQCWCGGARRPVRIDYVGRWGNDGPYVRVTDVPAWECDRCGERTFDHEVAVRLDRLVRDGSSGAERIDPLPVKGFGALEAAQP